MAARKRRQPFRGDPLPRARHVLMQARSARCWATRKRQRRYSLGIADDLATWRWIMAMGRAGECQCWRVSEWFPPARDRLRPRKRFNLAAERLLDPMDIPF